MAWHSVAAPPAAAAPQYAASAGRRSQARPFNTVAPTITGTVQSGQTVTAALGTWGGDPTITYAQKWLLNGIDDVTTSTRALVSGDEGKALRLLVTATNGLGATQALSAAYTVLAGIAYATWSPTDKGSVAVLSNGNLTATTKATNGGVRSTVGVSSGKHYMEFTSAGSRFPVFGVARATATLTAYPGFDANGWAYIGSTAKKITNTVQTAYGSVWSSASQVVGMKLDMDAGTVEFLLNNVSMGIAFTGLTGTVYAMCGGDTDSATSNITARFGPTGFTYSVPAGYNAGLHT